MSARTIQYFGFYSKYPFKKFSRYGMEIIYEGAIDNVPQEVWEMIEDVQEDLTNDEFKFVIIYTSGE